LREGRERIEGLGTRIVVVGTGADWQAERLMDEGMPFECLVDPEANLYRALDIGRVGIREWLRPSTVRRYLRAFRRGSRQGAVTGDWRRLSGVALVGPDRRLRWEHRAGGVGDYTTLDEIAEAARACR
jgi:hypothetical protein